ncbi:YceI family protein [Paraflavisolibacter sp. H34]|uniref:YceI family protein n=1 Tax=Huijunlia imazamoxiresistens TaxID=3127457 RepID=UPI003018332C
MTRVPRIAVLPLVLLLTGLTMSFALKNTANDSTFRSQNLSLVVKGTSTLHDWEMKSGGGNCQVTLALGAGDKVTGLSGLSFTAPTESLKSEHAAMDKNAYKALKSGSAKNITFVLSSAKVVPVDASTYTLHCLGKLTIAGTTRETDLAATVKYNAADKTFQCSGTKKLKMTEYKVEPPSFMMGTVKTGDEVAISFTTKIAR